MTLFFTKKHSRASPKLFDWADPLLASATLRTPPGKPDGLQVSVQERAVLELLYETGTKEDLEEAYNIFEGLRHPRTELLARLLVSCTSIKTVRLFLAWARETGVVNVDDLIENWPVRTGSDKRWMKRLKDGTLISLKQYG